MLGVLEWGFNMGINTQKLEDLIKARLPDAKVNIEGDGVRFSATVTSAEFRGMSRIEQHRIVYKALEGQIGVGKEVQALQLTTIPAE